VQKLFHRLKKAENRKQKVGSEDPKWKAESRNLI
jgi:hypothetical protein